MFGAWFSTIYVLYCSGSTRSLWAYTPNLFGWCTWPPNCVPEMVSLEYAFGFIKNTLPGHNTNTMWWSEWEWSPQAFYIWTLGSIRKCQLVGGGVSWGKHWGFRTHVISNELSLFLLGGCVSRYEFSATTPAPCLSTCCGAACHESQGRPPNILLFSISCLRHGILSEQ